MLAQRVRDYEVVLVLSPEATEEEITVTVERVDKLITDAGGSIAEHESWGLKRLAYPILKFNEGNYILVKFSMDASAVTEFKRSLDAAEDLIRFLVTRT